MVDFFVGAGVFFLVLIGTFLTLNLAFWLFFAAVSLTVSLRRTYTSPSPFYSNLFNSAYHVLCLYARLLVHTSGLELLPHDCRYLFVSNHRSLFDNMIQSLLLKNEPLAFISKKENFSIPMGRRFMRRCCYLSLDRGNTRSAIAVMNQAATLIKSGATSIGVYPEGSRSRDGQLHTFMPGCFRIAVHAKCPIVVASIRGTEQIAKIWPRRRIHIYVDILHVYLPAELADKNTITIATETQALLTHFLEKQDDTPTN